MTTSAEVPAVGARQPCPCGSGRRYKACHGSSKADRAFVARPFEGRTDEPEWVMLREVVPAATAPIKTKDGRTATLATVLPMAWPAMVRADGEVFVGLQTQGRSGDVAADFAGALAQALETEPGSAIMTVEAGSAPKLQDLLDPAPLEVTVRDGFDFWVEGVEDPGGAISESMERANAAVVPTARLSSVSAAYWCRMKERAHLRWALPYDEEQGLDAMARLSAARELALGEGTKYVGSFRAHGLLVPVWDLPHEMEAADVEVPAAALWERLQATVAEPRALTDDERRARTGLLSRQLTLR
ncbi:MAG TPA: DUF5926 family protein [Frankiaceae bacterium]|nr:DUF5926 family protein [Frankiaceae bacterium]